MNLDSPHPTSNRKAHHLCLEAVIFFHIDCVVAELTPMMKQWSELKAQAGSALLFFRLGDFYELFEDDAVKAAPILQVVLTARNNKGSGPSSPLCGVPVGNIEIYLNRALDAGLKVALVEQTEEPQPGRSLVRREIVQWFTPGIRLLKIEDRPHYCGLVAGTFDQWSLAAADVGTGHIVLESGTGAESLQDLIDRLPIEDLRFDKLNSDSLRVKYSEKTNLLLQEEAESHIVQAFGIANIDDSPAQSKLETLVLGSLLKILADAHPRDRLRYSRPKLLPSHVWMSAATRKNLYLFEPSDKCLFALMDKTQTALGRRELKTTLANPTQDRDEIQLRQSLVKKFKENSGMRKLFRSKISGIHDLHRLMRKRRGPQELYHIAQSLKFGFSASLCLERGHPDIDEFQNCSDDLRPLIEELEKSLRSSEDSELGWIQPGVNSTLDDLRNLKQNSETLLSSLEEKLRSETKANNLKIKFHQVFGYVIELTTSQKDKVPHGAKRIQTLANAERYKTPELEALEEKVLSLDSRIREAERSEILRLYSLIESREQALLNWAEALARLDCFQSMAEVSDIYQWVSPVTETESKTQILHIKDGFHPLSQGAFVPQTFELKQSSCQVMLLTGPNMSGKSTLLRLAALVALLHQIGSDVPARSARLSFFDRIVCRMGAQDDMTTGQSTFFVEMREVASMLHGATDRSLLIFDEIGRGTSTYDGMSLAWAITEEVHEFSALCFMATHYLELAELEKSLPHLKSYHLGVEEIQGRLIFTRTLKEGPASRSYGIQVAKLAEISPRILSRADSKLKELEKKRSRAVPLFELMQS